MRMTVLLCRTTFMKQAVMLEQLFQPTSCIKSAIGQEPHQVPASWVTRVDVENGRIVRKGTYLNHEQIFEHHCRISYQALK